MSLTEYYRMEEKVIRKSHRYDCTESAGTYEPLERIGRQSRDGSIYFYYNGVPDTFNAVAQRRTDKAITNGKNITSVYTPDINSPRLGYGDIRGTSDAVLFHISSDYKAMDIYIARGLKHHSKALFTAFVDGRLDKEIAELKNRAVQRYNKG